MDSSGVGGGGGSENPMLTQNHNSDLDSLSNLLINSYEDDAAALDQYESELEQNLQENLLIEKEQSIQRLFQSFQTSACNVAQMFKDKSTSQASVTSSWESFQNAAGAITVLYKDSLEACKIHMELGVHLGQQRKLKDLINFIKKKKNKRSIRKDELISFLIGKQYPSSQNQMFNLFSHQTANNAHNPFNLNHTSSAPANNRHRQINRNRSTLISTQSSMIANTNQSSSNNSTSSPMTTTAAASANNSSTNNSTMNSSVNNSVVVASAGGVAALPITNQLSLINSGDNSNGSEVETNSDLATFREALIMHNRSRDTPVNRTHTASQYHSNHHHHHQQNQPQRPSNHSHQCQTHSGALNTNTNSSTINNNNQSGCDDLDCFFCEQIATHIEHKRSSAQLNFDTESPTRKRGRFY